MAFSIEALFFLRDRASGPARGIAAAAQAAGTRLKGAGAQGQAAGTKIGVAAQAAGTKLRGAGGAAQAAGAQISGAAQTAGTKLKGLGAQAQGAADKLEVLKRQALAAGVAADKLNGAYINAGGKLVDASGRFLQVTRQAQGATRAMTGFGGVAARALERARTTAQRFGQDLERIGQISGRVAVALGVLGAATIFTGKSIVDAVGFKEQTLIGFETQLGSSTKALNTYRFALAFAARTPFETPEIISATQRLMAFNFTGRQIPRVLEAAGNAASGLGKGSFGMDRILTTLGQIKAKGRLQGDELLQLSEIGVNARTMLEQAYGVTGKAMDKLISNGAISADTAIGIIVRGMEKKFPKMMDKQSKSIFGLVSTLKSRPFELFQSLDANKELEPFKRVLQNLAAITDFDNNPVGKRIRKRFLSSVGGLFQSVFGRIADFTDPKAMERTVNRAFDTLDRFSAWIAREGPVIVRGVQDFGAGVRDGFAAVKSAYEFVRPFLEGAAGLLQKIIPQGDGGGSSLARLAGQVLALGGALKLLNVVTLGASGSLTRFLLQSVGRVVSVPVRFVGRAAGGLLSRAAQSAVQRSPVLNLGRRAVQGVRGVGRDVLGNMREAGRGAVSFVRERIPVARAAATRGARSLLTRVVSTTKTVGINILTRGVGALRTGVGVVKSVGLAALRAGGQLLLITARAGLGLLRLAAQGLLMGARLAAAWLIGMGPIGWIIGGIALIGAGLVLVYNRVGWFRDGVNAAWSWIKQATSDTAAWIGTAFTNAVNFVGTLPGKIAGFFSGLPDRIAGFLRTLPDKLLGIGQAVLDAVIPKGIRDAIGGAVSWVGDTAKNAANAFNNAVGNGANGAQAAGARLARGAAQGTAGALQIRSPSRVMTGYGVNAGSSFAGGMDRTARSVSRAAQRLARAAAPSVQRRAAPRAAVVPTPLAQRAAQPVNPAPLQAPRLEPRVIAPKPLERVTPRVEVVSPPAPVARVLPQAPAPSMTPAPRTSSPVTFAAGSIVIQVAAAAQQSPREVAAEVADILEERLELTALRMGAALQG
jgi:tape measure domain-containing protein